MSLFRFRKIGGGKFIHLLKKEIIQKLHDFFSFYDVISQKTVKNVNFGILNSVKKIEKNIFDILLKF